MKKLWDVVFFRKMISPIILQILFWAGIGGTFYGSYVLIKLEHWAWPLALVFGTLLVRVIFERAILSYQTFERLGLILKNLEQG